MTSSTILVLLRDLPEEDIALGGGWELRDSVEESMPCGDGGESQRVMGVVGA